ncbi:MAG: hypothetical protein IT370_04470 [Deltaproteobacteria bacterium]|nr:hypothetical protein [Deltaproteobacteria bacterium]
MPARPCDTPWTREASPFQTAFDHLLATAQPPSAAAPRPAASPPTPRPANDDFDAFDDWSDVMPTCA